MGDSRAGMVINLPVQRINRPPSGPAQYPGSDTAISLATSDLRKARDIMMLPNSECESISIRAAFLGVAGAARKGIVNYKLMKPYFGSPEMIEREFTFYDRYRILQ